MRYVDYSEEMPGSYDWWFAGDMHIGAAGFKQKLFRKFKRRVNAKKQSFVSVGGDIIEAITPDDPRYNIAAADPTKGRVHSQIRAAVGELKSIKDKIKIVLFGNHELRIDKRAQINPAEDIATGLGIEYPKNVKPLKGDDIAHMGDSFQVKVNLPTVRFLERHHMNNFTSRAQDEQMGEEHEGRWVKNQLRPLAADCEVMLMHHTHKMRMRPPLEKIRLIHDSKTGKTRGVYPKSMRIPLSKTQYHIPHDQVWYGSSGAWLGSYEEGITTYAELGGFPPTELGALRMIVKNDKLQCVEKVPFS